MRLALVTAALLLSCPLSAVADPLPSRDQNPFVSAFGLPMPLAPRIDASAWTTRVDMNWGSTALIQSDDDEVLLVDAETFEARWTLQRALNDRVALRLEVPWRYVGPGRLDGFIDDWHDLFGLPEGSRSDLPRNDLRIYYGNLGDSELDVDRSHAGLADVTGSLGYELVSTSAGAATAWLSMKFPTGDAEELTGSGALDWSLVIAAERRMAERWTAYGQAGVTRLGTGELLASQQEDWVWSGLAGIGWRAFEAFELKVQLDAHTAAYDANGFDYFGNAVILTVGGAWRSSTGWAVDAGVSEDLAVEGSPDVVFIVGLRRSW